MKQENIWKTKKKIWRLKNKVLSLSKIKKS